MKKTAIDLIDLLHSRSSEKIWNSIMDVLKIYFRLEIEGEENIPEGSSIILPNHSGYAGFDAILLLHELHRISGRSARILAHRAYFDWFKEVKLISESFGLKKATMANGKKLLEDGEMLVIFPEAEDGNFKPSKERYHLQRFKLGAIRLASQTNSLIVPCLIIGAEDSHINFKKIDLNKYGIDLKIPAPLNIFPLPAKWKIIFLPPVKIKPNCDFKEIAKEAELIKASLQKRLDHEIKKREYTYFRSYELKREVQRIALNILDSLFNHKK